MLYLYERGEEADLLLVKWWAQMKEDGDLNLAFARPPTLGTLMDCFRPPVQLLFKVDGGGISHTAWFEPIISGAYFSFWVRKSLRGNQRETLRTFLEAAERGFSEFEVLIGVTKQRGLLRLHQRLGYRLLGTIPRLFGGGRRFHFNLG